MNITSLDFGNLYIDFLNKMSSILKMHNFDLNVKTFESRIWDGLWWMTYESSFDMDQSTLF